MRDQIDDTDPRFNRPCWIVRKPCGCIDEICANEPDTLRGFLQDAKTRGRDPEFTTFGVAANEPTFLACPHE